MLYHAFNHYVFIREEGSKENCSMFLGNSFGIFTYCIKIKYAKRPRFVVYQQPLLLWYVSSSSFDINTWVMLALMLFNFHRVAHNWYGLLVLKFWLLLPRKTFLTTQLYLDIFNLRCFAIKFIQVTLMSLYYFLSIFSEKIEWLLVICRIEYY